GALYPAAPSGWLYADPPVGSPARGVGRPHRRKHYFGNLDPWRMVANSAFQAPLTPPDEALRQDPYDNQLGELSVDGQGQDRPGMARSVELVDFQYL
ncbi:MAG: transglutaminase domain-containing protein, partial [Clostridiales bacterium]|nr:transglutaminase domain-containing protein [Clostridiales bacterium]